MNSATPSDIQAIRRAAATRIRFLRWLVKMLEKRPLDALSMQAAVVIRQLVEEAS